jgi:HD-GYP domain-containing protein (c-di-GMP phosphodiesterase class II)
VELDEHYISRLSELGIHYIYINDETFGDTDEIEDVISEETRISTVKMVKKTFSHLQQDRNINTAGLRKVVNNMLDEILDNSNVLLSITDISALNDYVFYHSVSVCTLSIMTGITLGYDDTRLRELGVGALLHDIGKSKVKPEVLKREGNLNEEEFGMMAKHPELGFNLLRGYMDLSLLSAHVAYQHHERWDGRGYPRRLAGNDIHEYARIVAAANIYDELMAERPNRPPFEVNQAINLVRRMANIYFEPRIVTAMISNIASYPVGSIVRLNTGDIGIVTHLNNDAPHRPVMRIVFDSDQRRLKHPHEIDLSRMTTVIPVQVISERELNKLLPLRSKE